MSHRGILLQPAGSAQDAIRHNRCGHHRDEASAVLGVGAVDDHRAQRTRGRRGYGVARERKLAFGRNPNRSTRASTNSALRSRPPGVMSAESQVSRADAEFQWYR